MIKKVLFKISGALLRAHRYLDWRLKMGSGFKPRIVRYPAKLGTKKIVHVIGNFIVGGSSQLVVDIIEGTSDEYLHKIIVPYTEEQLAYQPVDIQAFSIAELRDLSAWLESEKPEFVHIHYFARPSDRHSFVAIWYEAIFRICEDLGLKIIQNVNVPTHPFPSSAVVHNVFVSQYVERNFNNSDCEQSVIYPGSDFTSFKNDNVDSLPPKCIGMVYRLDDDKLRSDAIEVFIKVVKIRPDITCYIVGGGHFLPQFRQRVRDERLEKMIHLDGYVSYEELPQIYKKFSIFVAPVYEESFGQVTPFAMSMGLCVAGYDTGALSEILGTSDTLVSTGDVDGLVELVLELLSDEEKRKRFAAANIRRSRHLFSLETMIDRYKDLYRDVYTRNAH